MKKLVFATTSLSRKQAFDELDIPYRAVGSKVEEYFKGRPNTPKELVSTLAKLKTEDVAKREKGIIIGFDSVVYFKKQILEKPKSYEESYKRIKNFSGKNYEFFTGIHLIDGKYQESTVINTKVQIRELQDKEIKKYLNQDPNFKKFSQGFDPLNTFGATFIKKIEGSYNNVLRGIPLEKIIEMIKRRGFQIK
jgi:septum formation protein